MIILILSQAGQCADLPDSEVPFILVHGTAADFTTLVQLAGLIKKDYPNRTIVPIQILFETFFGNDSSMYAQSERYSRYAALEIRDVAKGAKCIDLLGFSMGGMTTRYYIQRFSQLPGFPRVRYYYAVQGVMTGIFCYQAAGKECGLIDMMSALKTIVYTPLVKQVWMWAAFYRDPARMAEYVAQNNIMCQMDGECGQALVNKNFAQVEKMYTIYSADDDAIKPIEAQDFSTYSDPLNPTKIQPIEERDIYEKLGLKELRERKGWRRCRWTGYVHCEFVYDQVAIEFYQKYLGKIIRAGAGDDNVDECS